MRVGLAMAILVAGCLGQTPDTSAPTDEPAAEAYRVDCAIGNASWPETCLAWASPNESASKTEVDVVVNPLDPDNIFVASKDLDPQASDCVWAVGQISKDGGRTWKTVIIGGPAAERQPTEPLWGWDCITDPIMQFEPDGTLHYALQVYVYAPVADVVPDVDRRPELGMMMHAISHDGGETFPDVFYVMPSDGAVVINDYMRMGHNPRTGTVFTTWHQLHVGTGVVWPVVSAIESGSTTPRPPAYVLSAEDHTGFVAKGIAGAPDGTIHVSLVDYDDRSRAMWSSSTDDGRSFTAPVEVFRLTPMREDDMNTRFRTSTSTELAIDASGGPYHGCIYVTWPDGGQDVADVLVRRSCDAGATWTEARRVHEASAGAQFFPRVAVDGRGTVHVVYHTQTHDAGHRLLDTDWAYSLDGGDTWITTRLTQVSYDGDLGLHQDGFPFFGDYIGIAASGDTTVMAFPTTVTGRAEIAVARVGPA